LADGRDGFASGRKAGGPLRARKGNGSGHREGADGGAHLGGLRHASGRAKRARSLSLFRGAGGLRARPLLAIGGFRFLSRLASESGNSVREKRRAISGAERSAK